MEFIEILASIGLIAIIYHSYKFFEKEKKKKSFAQRIKGEGTNLVRKYSHNEWEASTLSKLNPIELEMTRPILPEDFDFYLNLPNDSGLIFIRYNSLKKWELQYVPKGGAFNYPFGIPIKDDELGTAFRIGDKFYEEKLNNKSITAKEFISKMNL